jgi:hypothetical protein
LISAPRKTLGANPRLKTEGPPYDAEPSSAGASLVPGVLFCAKTGAKINKAATIRKNNDI